MSNSILESTKKNLGIAADYTAFDQDIILHINSVFSTLNQLGLGPPSGFFIVDNTTLWSDYLGTNANLNSVKTYMYLKVRLLFDPPTTSYLITALENQVKEFEWRLNVAVDPQTEPIIYDGGTPDHETIQFVYDGGAP